MPESTEQLLLHSSWLWLQYSPTSWRDRVYRSEGAHDAEDTEARQTPLRTRKKNTHAVLSRKSILAAVILCLERLHMSDERAQASAWFFVPHRASVHTPKMDVMRRFLVFSTDLQCIY